MKDAVATMGAILPDDVGGRDAVHVAVIAMFAGEDLHPGQDVGYNGTIKDGHYVAYPIMDKFVGIVDPFIKGYVKKGEKFWLFLYPRTITGLNHLWTHPEFDESATGLYSSPSKKAASEKWIDDWAGQYGLRASKMIEEAKNWIDHGDHFSMGGTFEGEYVPDEFWDHYEVVTGKKVDRSDRESFFSCSC
jgi:hypothetical protein